MDITQKTISDDIYSLLNKFKRTDENRVPEPWMYHKINQVRADLMVRQYRETDIIDQSWYSDLGLVDFHEVNIADDVNAAYCDCPISKAYVPQVITLPTKSINQDLGFQMIMSACAKKTRYYNRSISQWNYIPKEHTYSLFRFYSRINTAMYVNAKVDQLRIVALLANPEQGFYTKSLPIASGSIVSGTSYIVVGDQIIYNAVIYNDGDTFTGTATTIFAGSGKVYLESQKTAYIETYPYPVSAEMARQIVIEICTKEFGIEKGQIADDTNDSEDDTQKSEK